MSGDIASSVKKWLDEESGYPLEMTTAAALEAAGFEIVQGDYFPDKNTGSLREIDVTGYVTHSDNGVQISVALLIECKSSVDKPWLLFTSKTDYPKTLAVVRRSTSTLGQRVLNKLQFDTTVQNSSLFALPDRCGYAMTIGFRKTGDKDPTYDALMGVCAGTLGHINRLAVVTIPKLVPFDWPTLVIKAPLLDCQLGPDGKTVVREIDQGTLVWRNPILNRHTIINVYRESAFIAALPGLKAAGSAFAEIAHGTYLTLEQGEPRQSSSAGGSYSSSNEDP